jgi:hypothetical protein
MVLMRLLSMQVWLLLDGMVLDVGRWLPEHPGGATIIPAQSLNCDCSRFFEVRWWGRCYTAHVTDVVTYVESVADSCVFGSTNCSSSVFSLRLQLPVCRIESVHACASLAPLG